MSDYWPVGMTIPTDQELLASIDGFLERTSMKPTRFGLGALGEGSLIDSLRKGRSLTLKSANRVIDFMRRHDGDPVDVAAADEIGLEGSEEASVHAEAGNL